MNVTNLLYLYYSIDFWFVNTFPKNFLKIFLEVFGLGCVVIARSEATKQSRVSRHSEGIARRIPLNEVQQ